ncbi:MAG: hypothetical protein QM651_07990 [Rhodoblastus sp.]
MVKVDDLMTDFDGAIARMVEEAKAEHDAIPEERRSDFYLRKAALHLARLIEIEAPSIVVQMAEDSLATKLRRRKRERRATSARG